MFRVAGVNIASFDCDFRGSGVEVLVLKLSNCSSVHGVGEIASEFLNVKFVGSETDLFVWIEADTYLAVLYLGMSLQPCHCIDDLCDTGFVVSSEKRVAVSYDEILTDVIEQFREFLRR